jgi:hypothetical protein
MNITKSSVAILILLSVCSCASLPNLPAANEVGLYQNGAFIILENKSSKNFSGELIAVEAGEILFLEQGQTGISALRKEEVKKFKVYNVKPRHYGWTIPAGIVASISHGIFSVFSLPLTLLITIPVTIGGENFLTLNQRNSAFEDLSMYARFPQGIPANVKRQDIH